MVNQRGVGNFCPTCVRKLNSERMKGNTFTKKTGEMVPCIVCGKEVYIARYKAANRKFCSKKCQHKWHRENDDITKFIATKLSGEQHPRYKHGKRIGKCESKPKLRNRLRDRDGDWCLFCGKPGPGLHMHRVIYGSQGGKYEESNCVLLCGEHHGLVHTSKKKWQPMLLAYLQDQNKKGWIEQLRGLA